MKTHQEHLCNYTVYCHTFLREAGKRTGLMTTANFKLDGQEWENTSRQSTLEALEVQQLLRRMVDQGIMHAVIEATSHGLELQRVRGCAFDEGQPFSVIVDYAHTPDSLAKVLATLRPLTTGKLLVVFGSAGERDVLKRPIMRKIAAQMANFFVITDEDPREEDREKILREIASGSEAAGKRDGRDFLCIADRTQAIATALARARVGDTILLAGKGHEQSIITGREKIPWDDRRVAREQLRSL